MGHEVEEELDDRGTKEGSRIGNSERGDEQ